MNEDELRVTADLAEIELTDEELASLGAAVEQLVSYFEIMAEADVDGLEPTTHALLRRNRIRADEPAMDPETDADDLLENAPELEDRFIVIPNVL